MIRITCEPISANSAHQLAAWQQSVDALPTFHERVEQAKTSFKRHNKTRNPVFREVRAKLAAACGDLQRCMYCEDNMAVEIEHHHPKTLYPSRAFDWTNYLYACGSCNRPKSSKFSVFSSRNSLRELIAGVEPPYGEPVLIDPRAEDPLKYLVLDLSETFVFVPLADRPGSRDYLRATYTIRILGLNSDIRQRARRSAHESYRALLVAYAVERDDGASARQLRLRRQALTRMPHSTVWHEMKRQRDLLPKLTHLFGRVPEALGWD